MQPDTLRTIRRVPAAPAWYWLGPLLAMLLIGLYFSARFGGRWAENDTALFATYIENVANSGRLVPDDSPAYPNGYAFQAISAFVLALTGLPIADFQQLIYPLLAAALVLPAWLTYRELTSTSRGAALATVLLFTQPEFLFVILRSSHEKFTRVLMLLCLFWLLRSYRLRRRLGPFALHVGLFYLTALAFIASNNLLAHSFIFAILLALVGGWWLQRRSRPAQADSYPLKRLGYAAVICLGLTYVFTFYIYLPAQHDLLILKESWERILSLLLDVQQKTTNAYAQVQAGWISLPVYFAVSIANWLVLVGSFVLWARQGWRWLRHDVAFAGETDRLLWLFYGAFVVQGGLSVLADASGVLGSNLQHRLFPSFAILAVAVVGKAIAGWRPRRFASVARTALAAAMACVAVLSVFKATNEPFLSNKWTFYGSDELAVMQWGEAHLRDTAIWAEFDERLSTARRTQQNIDLDSNYFVGSAGEIAFNDYIVSAITRLRAQRLELAIPAPADALQVYDNGAAQLYHRRPLTPYQK